MIRMVTAGICRKKCCIFFGLSIFVSCFLFYVMVQRILYPILNLTHYPVEFVPLQSNRSNEEAVRLAAFYGLDYNALPFPDLKQYQESSDINRAFSEYIFNSKHLTSSCSHRFRIHNGYIVELTSALLRPWRSKLHFSSDIDAPHEYRFFPGFLSIKNCVPHVFLWLHPHPFVPEWPFEYRINWLNALDGLAPGIEEESRRNISFGIMITRFEYANIWHTLTELYSVFLTCRLFNVDPKEVTVVIVDRRPIGPFDDVWTKMFPRTIFPFNSSVLTSFYFERLVLASPGHNTPLHWFHSFVAPFLEDFRGFFLESFDLKGLKSVNCSDFKVLMISRKPYNRPKSYGSYERVLMNEEEVRDRLALEIKGRGSVRLVNFAGVPLRQQLEMVLETNVLLGMHGAALAHSIFLPRPAVTVELKPYWLKAFLQFHDFFTAVARWRRNGHVEFTNNHWLDRDHSRSFFDVGPVIEAVKDGIDLICPPLKPSGLT